jgi:hypothetical protein
MDPCLAQGPSLNIATFADKWRHSDLARWLRMAYLDAWANGTPPQKKPKCVPGRNGHAL